MRIDIWQILGRISSLNWLLLAVCTAAFLGFYILDYRRWGCLSFNSYFFGFSYFLKVVVMYPLAWSANNIFATRQHFASILIHLDKALYITLGGFCCMLLGIVAARVITRTPPPACRIIYDIIANGWHSGGGISLGLLAIFGMTLALFLMGFQPFVARSLVFERNDLRPFYNLWSQIVPFFAINIIIFGAVQKKWPLLALGVLVAGLGVIGGNRTVAILSLMQVGVILGMPRRFRNLPMLLLGALVLASVAISISSLRTPSLKEQSDFLSSLLYGNNLSDLRDFAWILTGMDDHSFLWGKTYLAGYLGFVPTYLFKFRDEYGFGRVDATLAGIDPTLHSGLRPPIFGEMYLNFGLPGVFIGGFFYGLLVGRVMCWITQTLGHPEESGKLVPQIVVWTGFLVLQIIDSFVFTAAFYGVYVLAGLLFMGRILERLGARRS